MTTNLKIELKPLILSITLIMLFPSLFSQTNSSSDGLWSTAGNWTAGVPNSTEVVNITHAMTLDLNILIDNGGDYTVTDPGSITDPSGGTSYDINVRGSGSFDIDGNVTIEGNLTVINNGSITVRSGDTLRVGGNLLFKNSTSLTVEAGGVIIVDGDFSLQNSNNTVIDGTVSVGGNVNTRNTATITGTGNLEAGGTITTKNSSSVFGNTGDCDPGPCEEGSGQGLPIKLLDFAANQDYNNIVKVNWTTGSEINNHYFTVQGSIDGEQFNDLKMLAGAGNSNETKYYQTVVEGLNAEVFYLRLKQTDFDGKQEIFNPIAIRNNHLENERTNNLQVYPNPADGNTMQVKLHRDDVGFYTCKWINLQGQVVYMEELNITSSGTEILSGRSINPGFYYFHIQKGEKTFQEKVIVR